MKWTLGRALTPREYIICSQALQVQWLGVPLQNVVWKGQENNDMCVLFIFVVFPQILVDFFNADGDGLDMSVLKESEYRQCMGVLAQCSATTQELIRDYQRQIATTEERVSERTFLIFLSVHTMYRLIIMYEYANYYTTDTGAECVASPP